LHFVGVSALRAILTQALKRMITAVVLIVICLLHTALIDAQPVGVKVVFAGQHVKTSDAPREKAEDIRFECSCFPALTFSRSMKYSDAISIRTRPA
jgi:hypothetical protein